MGRLEKFKQERRNRRIVGLSLLLFFILVISGILVADYSVNTLMRNEKHINIVSFERVGESLIHIKFMDAGIYINTTYIRRDYQRLRDALKGFFRIG
ncbi:MAG: hypothetical protein N2489_06345 [Clostridia bacterium]|nr:hypothetical protein [Clostridia bacterium]